uniref:sigma-E factor negative regulatory protein n=1 Tax=Frateuria defendens TaxID=2219559 RepID=UPI00066FD627
MTEQHPEHLSAGMDGELSREELRFLLRRVEHDAALGQTWARYHVAREVLRRQSPATLAAEDFSLRVLRAIERPLAAVPASSRSARHRHWLRWSTGGAIAAGVAV